MYSNLNGKVVTTSEVYDMLTKKMVPYSDVMKVINGLTDKGGMFFDYQAKQAETLKGQLSNLVDAWNIMLNQIGQSNEGIMKGSISGLRELFTNWRTIESTIVGVVVAYGLYKAAQILTNATIGQANLGLSGLIGSEKYLSLGGGDIVASDEFSVLEDEEDFTRDLPLNMSDDEVKGLLGRLIVTGKQIGRASCRERVSSPV